MENSLRGVLTMEVRMNTQLRAGSIITVAVLLVVAGSCGRLAAQTARDGSAAVRAAIKAGNERIIDGVAQHDTALIVSVYTEDAEAFPPNSETVKGRPALQKHWQSALDSGLAAMEFNTTEIETDGKLAYEVGTYAVKIKDGTVVDRGKYCVVWKRVNGQWLLHRDIWTTSLPEAKK
jgi:ketosteroid isomerase-like protein